jgi:hypothetical protein
MVPLQEGLNLFGLLDFLRENPTSENRKMVLPTPADIQVTPSDFLSITMWRKDECYSESMEKFFEDFLSGLYGREYGMHQYILHFTNVAISTVAY